MHVACAMDALVRLIHDVAAAVRPIAPCARALALVATLGGSFVPSIAMARGGHGGGGHSGGGHSGGGHSGGGHSGGGHIGGGFGSGHVGGGFGSGHVGSGFGSGHVSGGQAGSNLRGNSGSPLSNGHISIRGRTASNVGGHWDAGSFRNQYVGRRNPFGRAYIGAPRVIVAPHWGRGYWGWNGGTWLRVDSDWWVTPQYPGWIWIGPEWVWDGTQWVLQPGYWAMANP